ncbi:tryptophan synthase subunit alpha [Streptomyces ureilyticus]|uniref:Tryptophan synthase alpha chain n=1 Tax=Streptomyces ureilyticus TaxID=1775131 RepID=A0ABX0DFJ0_9ACTN|nr:tryptophan synthase subunit alpha [Streptomyces ureilyticus]NGO40633.1 tryptophan synthase subunit alpha [Streptomyces ureilyticus]
MITSTSPSWSAARLDYALATSRAQGRAALGLYLPVGYPTRTASLDALHLMAQAADVLELGIPHTEPVLDGPEIQHAVAQALDAGFRMHDLFTAATELTASTTAALLVMSYWAPIEQYSAMAFAHQLAAAGGAGVLIPDLPDSAAATWQKAARAAGLHTVPLIPTHAPDARLAAIGTSSSGMVYAPASPGRTGARRPLNRYLPRLVRRVRDATGLPVAVGSGISTPEQAAEVSTYADAVVVGSAVIRRMYAQAAAPAAAAAAVAADFADGVRRAHRPVA